MRRSSRSSPSSEPVLEAFLPGAQHLQNLHPVLVHFPLAFLSGAAVLYLLAWASGRESWAILELDWEYPPYLEAFPEGAGSARVRVTLRDREDGALLHVSYRYAHQEGAPERGSMIRLYRLMSNGTMKALRETTPRQPLVLPPGSTGQFVASVIPRTSSKSGREYFSDPFGAGARIAERLSP